MPEIRLRRFSNVDVLRSLRGDDLRSLLAPYASYFEKRQVNLEGPVDLGKLAAVFLAPEEDVPLGLVNALYLLDEMSTPCEFEALVDLVRRDAALRVAIDLSQELTPLDLAVRLYLVAPRVLEREHAERLVDTRKAFDSYLPVAAGGVVPAALAPETLVAIEKDLSRWFASKLKGEHVRLFAYARDDAIHFLVEHGEPLRREPTRRDGAPATVFYRPEKNDVLVFSPKTGELRVAAATVGERDLYRRTLGRHLFGSEDHFHPSQARYTLRPLLATGANALACSDVDGLEWIHLIEFTYVRPAEGSSDAIVEVRVANNGTKPIHALVPERAQIVSARLRVKFSGVKRPRYVTLRLPNVAMFTREDDASLVTEWLRRRGFVLGG